MLRMIIDRVKSIEDGSKNYTSLFNSTESYTGSYSRSRVKEGIEKQQFESNILKAIDESNFNTDDGGSSYIVMDERRRKMRKEEGKDFRFSI